jgi:hypothetical protein
MKPLLQNMQGPDIWRFEEVPNFSGELLDKEFLLDYGGLEVHQFTAEIVHQNLYSNSEQHINLELV